MCIQSTWNGLTDFMNEWTRKEFNDSLTSQTTGLVYLYTPLCGTCQVASRMLEITTQILPDITTGKMDINYMPDLARDLTIQSVPCLLFIKNGEVKEEVYAFQSVPYLLEKIKEVLY